MVDVGIVGLVFPSRRMVDVGSWGWCLVAVRMLPVVSPADLWVSVSAWFPPLGRVRRLLATRGIIGGAEFLPARYS